MQELKKENLKRKAYLDAGNAYMAYLKDPKEPEKVRAFIDCVCPWRGLGLMGVMCWKAHMF